MNNWISVNDRLPETDSCYRQYLTVVRYSFTSDLQVCVLTYRGDIKEFGEWSYAPKRINDVWHKADVLYWQPLPEPPAEVFHA